MARESKYIPLANNVLLEYIYDDDNLKKENYSIIKNLNLNEKGYCSETGLNKFENQVFLVDALSKKYAKVDPTKYNFLKTETYELTISHFETVRLHLPTTFSFIDNQYIGLYLRIYTYDYMNEKEVNLSSLIYDDTKVNEDKNIVLNTEFIYSDQQWGKYLTFEIPSLSEISRQRTNNTSANLPLNNSLNINLSDYGLSQESPIFFDFSWIISRQLLLGETYYFFSDLHTKSISNKPEYETLGVQVEESKDGDYFEIYGTYNQSNESLDDWVDEMVMKGRKVRIEYVVSLLEENILTTQHTYVISENFTEKILYRPVITFSKTIASIDVEMVVIDLFDNSKITKFASIGLKSNIFKYGRTLAKINVDNIYKPKIYNQKIINPKNTVMGSSPDINLTKVNYPVIVDRVKILVSASPSKDSEHKAMGLSEIIINPFGSIFKFDIATVDNNGDTIPYNLTKISENSTITLSFKDDSTFLEKEIWQQTNDNNFEIGTIIFKIDEMDLPAIKTISNNNMNYYLTIKSSETGARTLLYSGKFLFFNNLAFVNSNDSISDDNYKDFSDLNIDDVSSLLNDNVSGGLDTNKNLFVFLKPDVDVNTFEKYLFEINADINFKQGGGNSSILTYMYFILNIDSQTIYNIKQREEVMELKEIPFCIGKNKKTQVKNIEKIIKSTTDFNCIAATRASSVKLKTPTQIKRIL